MEPSRPPTSAHPDHLDRDLPRPRCARCALPPAFCLCPETPSLATAVELVLLIHHREARKPTNTGLLAARSLTRSAVHVVGVLGQPVDYATVVRPEALNLLLFPEKDAVILSPALLHEARQPVRLIVPDGNWSQARRLRRRLSAHGPLLPVGLPEGPRSPYPLRREAREQPEGLATCEAIAGAYRALGETAVGDALHALFNLFVERYLAAHGRRRR